MSRKKLSKIKNNFKLRHYRVVTFVAMTSFISIGKTFKRTKLESFSVETIPGIEKKGSGIGIFGAFLKSSTPGIFGMDGFFRRNP